MSRGRLRTASRTARIHQLHCLRMGQILKTGIGNTDIFTDVEHY